MRVSVSVMGEGEGCGEGETYPTWAWRLPTVSSVSSPASTTRHARVERVALSGTRAEMTSGLSRNGEPVRTARVRMPLSPCAYKQMNASNRTHCRYNMNTACRDNVSGCMMVHRVCVKLQGTCTLRLMARDPRMLLCSLNHDSTRHDKWYMIA